MVRVIDYEFMADLVRAAIFEKAEVSSEQMPPLVCFNLAILR